jgi:predicted nucleic acid-binding protein
MLAAGVSVVVPAIADYEVRRELVRTKRNASIRRLDILNNDLGVIPVDPDVWHQAADLWARARNQGQPTAGPAELDGDVILAATSIVLERQEGEPVVVATTNVGHLSRFVTADHWSHIAPPTV